MKSIYKKEKIDSGLEHLSNSIVQATRNSTNVIEKLNCLSQWPKNYPHASDLTRDWHKYLFSNKFDDLDENWYCEIKFDKKTLYLLEFNIFNYFLSILPFHFYEKEINLENNKKFRWSDKEFKLLQTKLFSARYDHTLHLTRNDDPEGYEMVDRETKISLKHVAKSCKMTKKFFRKEKLKESIYSTTVLQSKIIDGMPQYQYQFQEDLFLIYITNFIDGLPKLLDNYIDNYYTNGTYLHQYFNWCDS